MSVLVLKIFWQEGIFLAQIEHVISSIRILLNLAGADQQIKVEYGTSYELEGYKCKDPDSFVFDYIDVARLHNALLRKKIEKKETFCFFLMTRDRLFYNENGFTKFVAGWAMQNVGCIVTAGTRAYLDNQVFKKSLDSVIMHELGHFFGLGHCDDITCVMYGLSNSKYLDLLRKPFCEKCLPKLLVCFKQSDSVT